jgi:hypothetical protein
MRSLASPQATGLYSKVLEGASVTRPVSLHGAEAKDNDIRIENRAGAGVYITSVDR